MSATKSSPEIQLARLAKEVRELRTQLQGADEREDVQQKAFDQLYEELRQYKEDFVFQMEKPLLLDLLLFYDSLNWFQTSLINKELDASAIGESFQYMIDEFLELLYRRDVVPLETPDHFDRRTQKAVKVIPANQGEEDYKVREVVKKGFTRKDKVLRAEEVVVARQGDVGGSR